MVWQLEFGNILIKPVGHRKGCPLICGMFRVRIPTTNLFRASGAQHELQCTAVDHNREWYSRFTAGRLLPIDDFAFFTEQNKHQDLVGSSDKGKSSSVYLCHNPNTFTQHSTMNVAAFKSITILNFIMTKASRFKSNDTHNNYLFIVNLIKKFYNLRNREFNDMYRKML